MYESLKLTSLELAKMIDYSLLKPYANNNDFLKVCNESKKYNFKVVAVNSYAVKICRKMLENSRVSIGGAIGFPLGQMTIETKMFETFEAIQNGAKEIDYVINITELKNKNWDFIKHEMSRIIQICREKDIISKVIFETCYLEEDEIKRLCKIALEVKPDFVKTSTGFGIAGATIENVTLMKDIVENHIKIKASGGINDLKKAISFIEAGAERIGTSHAVSIIEELKQIEKTTKNPAGI
jgi:deoxyribose-phosphate aldolase